MIPLSPSWLFLLPVMAALLCILACGAYYAWRSAPAPRRKRASQIYRCAVCRHVYVDSRDLPLARCPRCSCLNEAVKR